MRGNLPTKEPNIEKFWNENNIYQKMLVSNNKDKAFYLHDDGYYRNLLFGCGNGDIFWNTLHKIYVIDCHFWI